MIWRGRGGDPVQAGSPERAYPVSNEREGQNTLRGSFVTIEALK